MSEAISPTSIYGLAFSIIVSGGVAGAIFGLIRDVLLKRKEVYLDIAKSKIQSFEKARPYYVQLALYSEYVANLIKQKDKKLTEIIYFLSKMIFMADELNVKFGGWVLFDNLHADAILGNLFSEITGTIFFDYTHFDILAEIGRNESTYMHFTKNHRKYKSITGIVKVMLDEVKSREEEIYLKDRLEWLATLINLEMVFFYKPWYGELPYLDEVSTELLKYANDNFPGYHKRLLALDKSKFSRKQRRLRTPHKNSVLKRM